MCVLTVTLGDPVEQDEGKAAGGKRVLRGFDESTLDCLAIGAPLLYPCLFLAHGVEPWLCSSCT